MDPVHEVSGEESSSGNSFCNDDDDDSAFETGQHAPSLQQQQAPQQQQLASISESVGWYFPQVKLASWDPENEKQWANGGHAIAHRNLLVSIPNLCSAFGVWLAWSIIASKIQLMHDQDPTVYPFQDWGSPQGSEYNLLLYTLPSVAGLSGGTLRIANSFLTQIIGGRNVVAHSSVMLTLAMMLTAIVLNSRTTPFNYLLVAAWLSGTGGGAFASSMSNMSFLYPKSKQGYCLGFNGGLGNFGVSMTQLLLPMFMSFSFGKQPLAFSDDDDNDDNSDPDAVEGWPNHAGWFWWPICTISAVAAFVWMSNLPTHGNHSSDRDARVWNVIYYYWFEGVSLGIGGIAILILVFTRDAPMFTSSPGRKILQSITLVVIAATMQHVALVYTSPKRTMSSLRAQAKMFHDKHTWIMTILYIMSFGSFIGFSGAFPKLITDLFGYVTAEGCYHTHSSSFGINNNETATATVSSSSAGLLTENDLSSSSSSFWFVEDGTQFDCEANNGIWGTSTVTNPNAPDVFKFAWMGPAIGSLIRPIGGMLADAHGGAKVTQVLIIWCTVATLCLGMLVAKTGELEQPELNFGLFVFLFLNVFFCTGALNGTTFRTIGVLFDHQLAGPVLGWSSAIASYGAYIIPSMFSVSISTGKPERTLYGLAAYYFFCSILNYWYYCRPGCERPGV